MNAAKLITSIWVKGKAMGKYLNDICNVVQIFTMYNYIVGVYRKVGVSQYTRLAMKTVLATVQKNAELIVTYMNQFLPQVNGTEHMESYLHALSVYRLMVAQIKKDTFNPITKKELFLEKKVLVDNTSQRSRMALALD